jgi:hypothetical protein
MRLCIALFWELIIVFMCIICILIFNKVQAQCIKGIQRVREMWKIYMDNEEDRQSLLVQGINLRGRQIPLHLQNRIISVLELWLPRMKYSCYVFTYFQHSWYRFA